MYSQWAKEKPAANSGSLPEAAGSHAAGLIPEMDVK